MRWPACGQQNNLLEFPQTKRSSVETFGLYKLIVLVVSVLLEGVYWFHSVLVCVNNGLLCCSIYSVFSTLLLLLFVILLVILIFVLYFCKFGYLRRWQNNKVLWQSLSCKNGYFQMKAILRLCLKLAVLSLFGKNLLFLYKIISIWYNFIFVKAI